MLVSIITVSYNSSATIRSTLESVSNQSYPKIEHIIIDGQSKDGTQEIIEEFQHVSQFISEPDKGIYDAMNKGIKLATGDVIGILNSDDTFYDNSTIDLVANTFKNSDVDSVYGDVQFVSPGDKLKVLRYYSSKLWNMDRFKYGFMPAHPSFYVRSNFYTKLGLYKTNYRISADFDLLLRYYLIHKISYHYIQKPIVNMLPGGVSTSNFKMKYILNKEVIQSCLENGIPSNWFYMFYRMFVKLLTK